MGRKDRMRLFGCSTAPLVPAATSGRAVARRQPEPTASPQAPCLEMLWLCQVTSLAYQIPSREVSCPQTRSSSWKHFLERSPYPNILLHSLDSNIPSLSSRAKSLFKWNWFAPRNQELFWEFVFSLTLSGNHCKGSPNMKHPEPENLSRWHKGVSK